MGLPSIDITFKEIKRTVIARGSRGIVALILEDTIPTKYFEVSSTRDIPAGLSAMNKEQIELALMGFDTPPKKVVAYIIDPSGELAADYTEAKAHLETVKWNYLAVPQIKADAVSAMANYVISLRDEKEKRVKAVLPNISANHEAIVNYTTVYAKTATKEYTTAEYCARIAGIITGTPLNSSCTFAPLPELVDCEKRTKAEYDLAIDSGELVLYHDGEKIKIARGVNSLTTLSEAKTESFKKIKIVDSMDLIHTDLKISIEDSFLGKYANTYDNKCLLITSIKNYLEELEREDVLLKGHSEVDIDMEAQTAYLKSLGNIVEEMTDKEIKEADTKDKVFLTAKIKILDAIEEIALPIAI